MKSALAAAVFLVCASGAAAAGPGYLAYDDSCDTDAYAEPATFGYGYGGYYRPYYRGYYGGGYYRPYYRGYYGGYGGYRGYGYGYRPRYYGGYGYGRRY